MTKGQNANFTLGCICGALAVVITLVILINCLFFGNNTDSGQINVTIKDKDSSDFTVYTDMKNIYTTNKYEWKSLEINHTYQCKSYFTGISNCTEISL